MRFRLRKSVRLGRGLYWSATSYNDEANALLFAYCLVVLAGYLVCLAWALFLCCIYVVLRVALGLVSLALSLAAVMARLLIHTYNFALRSLGFALQTSHAGAKIATLAGPAIARRLGASAVALRAQANWLATDASSRLARARPALLDAWHRCCTTYHRLPAWSQPIVWGVLASVPGVVVIVVLFAALN